MCAAFLRRYGVAVPASCAPVIDGTDQNCSSFLSRLCSDLCDTPAAGCSLIATYSVFFCWAASYDQYPRESHSLPQASWTPDERSEDTSAAFWTRVPHFRPHRGQRLAGEAPSHRGLRAAPAPKTYLGRVPRTQLASRPRRLQREAPWRRAPQRFPGGLGGPAIRNSAAGRGRPRRGSVLRL